MTALSSKEAYEQILASGLIKKLHKGIVESMYHDQNFRISMTTREIAVACRVQRDSISPRLPELKRLGVVMTGPRRMCSFSGFKCVTWRLTGNPPVEPPKRYFMSCEHCHGKGKVEIFGVDVAK